MIEKYHVKWNSQSADSGESMPCKGFDAGANVWVENDDLMMYIDRNSRIFECLFPYVGRKRLPRSKDSYMSGCIMI